MKNRTILYSMLGVRRSAFGVFFLLLHSSLAQITVSPPAGGGGGGDALTTNPLSQFAPTTSLQLKGVISDETTAGWNLFILPNPSAITFLKINADNSVTAESASAHRTSLGLAIGTNIEAWDADLDTWATLTPSANLQTMVPHTFAQMRTDLGLLIGTNVEAWDTDLDTWATLTPSANFQTMVPHTFAQMRTDLGLVIGTNVEAWDADLDTWAGITPGTGVGTALAINVGSAGAFVTNGGTGTNMTLVTPVISSGLTASGSGANTFAASTGTFITSTGLNTLSANTTVTGTVTISPAARSGSTAQYFTLNIPSDTSITTNVESIGYWHKSATRAFAAGTVALQRENLLDGPTYNGTAIGTTFTDAFTLYLTPPIVGTNMTFTRGHTLGIVDSTSAASSITGGFVVATTLGTAATSVGIGGGKVNAGTSITAPALVGTTGVGIFNFNQAAQSQVVVSATEYYITRSDLDMPATYSTAIAAGTTMRWRIALTKTAAGTGTFQILLKKGTNGSTTDTSIVTQTIGTQTAAADNMECDIVLTWTSATAAYWTMIPRQSAASATGFGLVYPAAAAQFSGTISGQTTTTASDKYGLSVIFTTGTPTFVVNSVAAQAFGVN
jgi:hypothetical protein